MLIEYFIKSNAFLYIIILIIYVFIVLKNNWKIRFSIFYSFLLIILPLLGNTNFFIFKILGIYRDINTDKLNLLNFFSMILFLVIQVFMLKKIDFREKESKNINNVNAKKIILFLVLGSFIGIILFLVNLGSIGILILKEGLKGNERFYLKSWGVNTKIFYLYSFNLFLLLIVFFHYKIRNLLTIFLLIINILFCSSIGSRTIVLFPILTYGIFVLYSKEDLNYKKIIILLFLNLAIAYIILILRGWHFKYGNNILYILGLEYRNFITYPEYGFNGGVKTNAFLNFVFQLIPKPFYELIGLNKSELVFIPEYYYGNILGRSYGIRGGIWYDIFISSSSQLMYVLNFAVLSFFINVVEFLLIKYRSSSLNLIFFSILACSLFFTIFNSLSVSGMIFYGYMIVYLPFYIFMKVF